MSKTAGSKEVKVSARERLYRAAARLFYTNGIKATGIDTIVEESGVTKMTLYKHFPSKKKLIMEYLKTSEEEFFNWFNGEVEKRSKTVKDKPYVVFEVLETRVSQPEFRGCHFINVMVEVSDTTTEEHRFAQQNKAGFLAYIEKLLKEAGYKETKKLSEQLFLIFEGVIIRSQMDGNSKYAQVAKTLVASLLKKRK